MYAPAEIGRLLLSLTRRRVGPGAAEGRVGVLGALCEQLTAFAIALHSDIDSGVGSIGFRSVGVADRGWSSPGGMCGGMRERGSGHIDSLHSYHIRDLNRYGSKNDFFFTKIITLIKVSSTPCSRQVNSIEGIKGSY